MSASIPIKHHYIPKFLLRPFCFEEERLHYCNRQEFCLSDKKIEEVFMVRNLYKDDINHAENPTQIETDLAKFESEVSKSIKKFRENDDIEITIEEEDALKLFIAIMGFRSERASKTFGDFTNDDFKEFYSFYQEDGNLTDFWKRNLGYLVNCRSIFEVGDHAGIDEPIKKFMLRDSEGIVGMYFIVAESRGNEEFVMGDQMPCCRVGSTDNGIELPLYNYIPISPTRVLLQVSYGAKFAPEKVSGFRRDFFKMPTPSEDRKRMVHHVKRIYEQDVKDINSLTIELSTGGFVFKNKDRISLRRYEELYGDFKIHR